MKQKIAVFDIDDTLLPYGQEKLSLLHLYALRELKKDCILVLATGRNLSSIPTHIIQDIQPDYFITINGHAIYNNKKEVLFIKRLNPELLLSLLHDCVKLNFILTFKFTDEHVVAHCPLNQKLSSNLKHIHDPETVLNNHEAPCGAFLINNDVPITDLIHTYSPFTFAKAGRNGYEIYDSTIDKSTGVQFILNKLNMNWSQVLAFGDSENDIPLLTKAKLGFAMENAQDFVKGCSNHVIGSCNEDGIYYALLNLNMIHEYKKKD